jgi:hypothetical protein
MELKEWVAIFQERKRLFFGTVSIFLLAGLAFCFLQPRGYAADLTLNVARTGSQQTAEYKYDGFYRLQADERFADTVVRWLGSPRMTMNIYAAVRVDPGEGGLLARSGRFKAERLSSQMIRVRYWTKEAASARDLARSLVAAVNSEAEALNGGRWEESWFRVVGDEPVVSDSRVDWATVLAAAAALGLLFGFWLVLLGHYFTKEGPVAGTVE